MAAIDETRFLSLGGLDQWVRVRGADTRNPPLVMLHGGPGMSETGFFHRHNRVLEQDFNVVYWDQRGAGKSYRRGIPLETMRCEQFLTDLDELVDCVRSRLDAPKVVLFGHSWGSALGVLYASRFPAKVAVYAGAGQLGDWQAAERSAYAWVLDEARRRGKRRAIEQLTKIGPPPHDGTKLWTQRMWLLQLEDRVGLGAGVDLLRTFSIFDLPRQLRGLRFSLDAMWPEVSRIDLTQRVPALEMPVFFLLGRNDHWVDPKTSVAFLEGLKAPAKSLIWFERSGHEPFVDAPGRFNTVMTGEVRRAALAAMSGAVTAGAAAR